jgi:hypothetical protein
MVLLAILVTSSCFHFIPNYLFIELNIYYGLFEIDFAETYAATATAATILITNFYFVVIVVN